MAAWPYHVQCPTHASFTHVLRGQSLTIAPLITQSTQVPIAKINRQHFINETFQIVTRSNLVIPVSRSVHVLLRAHLLNIAA